MAKDAFADALTRAAGRSPVAHHPKTAPSEPPPSAVAQLRPAEPAPRRGARDGKSLIGGYFSPEVKSSLLLVMSQRPGVTQQDLVAEALDELFAKHNVPQVARNSR